MRRLDREWRLEWEVEEEVKLEVGLFKVVDWSEDAAEEIGVGVDFPEFDGGLRWLLRWRGDECFGCGDVGGMASTAIFLLHIIFRIVVNFLKTFF